MIVKRIYERPRLVVVSDDAAKSNVSFATTAYEHSPDTVQVVIDAGPACLAIYLKQADLLKLSKLFDDAAAVVGG